MKIKPIHDYVLVKRTDAESKTAGGLIIPDTAKEKSMRGVVIAVGEGKRDENGKIIPMTLKENDKVLFTKWSGTEVKINDETLLVMKENDVIALIEE